MRAARAARLFVLIQPIGSLIHGIVVTGEMYVTERTHGWLNMTRFLGRES